VTISVTPSPDASLPWCSGPYSIKRRGVSLTTCDSEPVQAPGCNQAHGALLVLRLSDFTILQVSENSAEFFDETPDAMIVQEDAMIAGAKETFRTHVGTHFTAAYIACYRPLEFHEFT